MMEDMAAIPTSTRAIAIGVGLPGKRRVMIYV
jgi:hypothetical protein